MKRVRELTRKFFTFFMVVALALGMLVVPTEKTAASETGNQRIQDAKNAVVQVMVCVQDPLGDWYDLVGGTGFLIGTEENAQYVVTNDHVAHATNVTWLS